MEGFLINEALIIGFNFSSVHNQQFSDRIYFVLLETTHQIIHIKTQIMFCLCCQPIYFPDQLSNISNFFVTKNLFAVSIVFYVQSA